MIIPLPESSADLFVFSVAFLILSLSVMEKKCKKAKWLSEDTLKIAVKR